VAASRHQARNSLNCTPSPFSRASSATRRNQEFCTAMSPSDDSHLACTSPVRMSPSHHPTPSFGMSARRLGTIVRFSPPIAHLTDVALGKRRFDHAGKSLLVYPNQQTLFVFAACLKGARRSPAQVGRARPSLHRRRRIFPTSTPEGVRRGFRAATWIVTNKTNGFGLSFGSTDAEYACGFDRARR
jgi:hypothetical protein